MDTWGNTVSEKDSIVRPPCCWSSTHPSRRRALPRAEMLSDHHHGTPDTQPYPQRPIALCYMRRQGQNGRMTSPVSSLLLARLSHAEKCMWQFLKKGMECDGKVSRVPMHPEVSRQRRQLTPPLLGSGWV